MTAGCEATPLPEPAFCISDGSSARRDPAAAQGFAQAGVARSLLLPCLQHPLLLLLPGLLALCPTAASAASASSQCCSFVHLVFVQCCSWKCLWQLWPVGTGASLGIPRCSAHLEAPQSLGSPPPGAALSSSSSSTAAMVTSSAPGASWEQSKPRRAPQSLPGEGALLPLLCCLTSFSQIRSGRRKEMVNSAHEFVCCHGRYKPGKEEHSLTVATFAFSGFPSRI